MNVTRVETGDCTRPNLRNPRRQAWNRPVERRNRRYGKLRKGPRHQPRLREQALMSEVPPGPQALTGSMALMAGEFGSVVQPWRLAPADRTAKTKSRERINLLHLCGWSDDDEPAAAETVRGSVDLLADIGEHADAASPRSEDQAVSAARGR